LQLYLLITKHFSGNDDIVGFDVCHDSQWENISFVTLISTLLTMNDSHTRYRYFSCVEPHISEEALSVNFTTGIISKC